MDTTERLKHQKKKVQDRRKIRKTEEKKEAEEAEKFDRDYYKLGGIQHIICSATMTIDNSGRVTPRQQKLMKKKGIQQSQMQSTLESLCKILKFRSKNPKVIDLTEEDQQEGTIMPSTLDENLVRCKQEEKDLYLYYLLQ
jgi:hypothetical protein